MGFDLRTVITQRDAAALIGVSTRWALKLVKDGFIKKNAQGKYEVGAVVSGYVASLKSDKADDSKKTADSAYNSERLVKLQMSNAKDANDLIEIGEALAAMENLVGLVRSEITSIPARVTRDMTERRKIDEIVNDGLSRITKQLEKEAGALRKSGAASKAHA